MYLLPKPHIKLKLQALSGSNFLNTDIESIGLQGIAHVLLDKGLLGVLKGHVVIR